MNLDLARQYAAQAWCKPSTSHLVMEPALAEAFAKILHQETTFTHLFVLNIDEKVLQDIEKELPSLMSQPSGPTIGLVYRMIGLLRKNKHFYSFTATKEYMESWGKDESKDTNL